MRCSLGYMSLNMGRLSIQDHPVVLRSVDVDHNSVTLTTNLNGFGF